MLNLSRYDNADRNTLTSAYNSLEKKQAKLLITSKIMDDLHKRSEALR